MVDNLNDYEGDMPNTHLEQQIQQQIALNDTPAPVQFQPQSKVVYVAAQPQPQVHVIQAPAPQPQIHVIQAAAPQVQTQNNGCYGCCIIANAILFVILSVVCIWALVNGVYIDDITSYKEESLQTMYICFLVFGGVFSLTFIVYAKAKGSMDPGFWTLGTFSMLSNITGLSFGLFCCLCTCFAADSMVWISKTNNIEILDSINVQSDNAPDISDIAHYTPLRDIEIGDYVLTMDPWTKRVFWDEIKLKIHYSWYDNANNYYQMRKLHLENNISSITLSDDHFVFIDINNKPTVIQSAAVEIGDMMYHYDYNTKSQTLQKVIEIDDNVMTQKRVFFTMSPYLLVDNIVASPYIGPNPIYHTILHKSYSFGMRFVSTHPYVWSMFSVFGYFIIYGSYYIVSHYYEFVAITIGTSYLFSYMYKKHVQ